MTTSAQALARVTVVIVNYNSGPWLARCVRNLRNRGASVPRVVVVDNASSDGSLNLLPDLPDIVVRKVRRNLGFGRGVNQAMRQVETEFALILNPDCLIVPDALAQLVQELETHPGCAMVSGRVFDMRGNEQRGSRRRLPSRRQIIGEVMPFRHEGGIDLTHQPSPEESVEVEALSGACMLVRVAALDEIGGFDPAFHMHFEDLDVMIRLQQAGWTLRLVPSVLASHAGGVSSSQRSLAVLWAKHRSLWRYLNKHCSEGWTPGSRVLWWLAIFSHALVRSPLAALRRS